MLGYLYELYNGYLTKSGNSSNSSKFYNLSLIKNDDKTYSIHGLWPQYSKNKYPTFCKSVDFSIDKLESLMGELNKYWYSTKEKNEDFWKHEYEKHGSCMFKEMTEYEYFNTTLSLYFEAVSLNIIKKYDNKNGKILIPLDLNFNFI